MSGRSVILDFGGNSAADRNPKVVVRKGPNLGSYRCLSCGHLDYLPRWAWARAAKPRCTACGGALEESEGSRQRAQPRSKRRAADKAHDAAMTAIRSSIPCWSCGRRCKDEAELAVHVGSDSSCLYEYKADKKTVRLPEGLFAMGTGWAVLALKLPEAGGKPLLMQFRYIYGTRADAQDLIDSINGKAR